MVEAAKEKYGALHIAFNNAGIVGPVGPVAGIPIEEWDKVISVNLSAVFYGMHYQIPAIIESGGGNIVNTASIMGQVAAANQSGYNSAKQGVVGLTKSAALDYSDKKVRINAVGPGYIDTPLLDFLDEEQIQHLVGLGHVAICPPFPADQLSQSYQDDVVLDDRLFYRRSIAGNDYTSL